MIPLKLTIKGFLSYRERVEIDFTPLRLACISGSNGAGKSTLLDAITWVLFGVARSGDESVINASPNVTAAEVTFDFRYEEAIYRVIRKKPHGKSGSVEFYVRPPKRESWNVITEANARDTNRAISQTLHMDYDTFINASFFLQGKADQFTGKKPGERRETLMNILDLNIWESYKENAKDARKRDEGQVEQVKAEIGEKQRELEEEPARREALTRAKATYEQASLRKEQAERDHHNAVEQRNRFEEKQRALKETQTRESEIRREVTDLNLKIAAHRHKLSELDSILSQRDAIVDRHERLNRLRARLSELSLTAESFHVLTAQKRELENQIQQEKIRLEEEVRALVAKEGDIQKRLADLERYGQQAQQLRAQLSEKTEAAKDGVHVREEWNQTDQTLRRLLEELQQNTEENRLRAVITAMEGQLKQTIAQLEPVERHISETEAERQRTAAELSQRTAAKQSLSQQAAEREALSVESTDIQRQLGACAPLREQYQAELSKLRKQYSLIKKETGSVCPHCGQLMSPEHCQRLLKEYTLLGNDLNRKVEQNEREEALLRERFAAVSEQLKNALDAAEKINQEEITITKLSARLRQLTETLTQWQTEDSPRLREARERLQSDAYCAEERERLRVLLEEKTEKQQQAQDLTRQRERLDQSLNQIRAAEAEAGRLKERITALKTAMEGIETQHRHWIEREEPILTADRQRLDSGDYGQSQRVQIASLTAEITALGYDPAAHQQIRAEEESLRPAEDELRALLSAERDAQHLRELLTDTSQQQTKRQSQWDELRQQIDEQSQQVEALRAALPDVTQMKKDYQEAQDALTRATRDYLGAEQLVSVLEDLRERHKTLREKQKTLEQRIDRLKRLETAFSKNGIPSLLIEHALPDIENRANDLLLSLTNGRMTLRFITQKDYASKKDAKKETLDILISDEYGTRPYELFSGGEAFRINFAIRMALSHILATRAGCKLQTLVIDEGFGSQDDEGRARLVEAIQAIQNDFEMILVVTHLEELKEAFPSRIEVSKSHNGSTVEVIG